MSLFFPGRGLHYVSLRIRERLGYIAEELKGYDIIGLQEVRPFVRPILLYAGHTLSLHSAI